MRLSDAIALGRTMVSRCRAGGSTAISAKPGDGCVLDMAALAVGRKDWQEAKDVWPWLRGMVPNYGSVRFYEEEVYQQFDYAVMEGKMTLDQLIDWVRSVEPAETPAPQPTEGASSLADAHTELVAKNF